MKYKIFKRLLIALFILLSLAGVVFTLAHKVSESTIKKNLESATKKQLDFSIKQLEKDLKQLEALNILLINDININSHTNSAEFGGYINHLLEKKYIEEKLQIQRSTNQFSNDLTVYWPQNQEMISTSNGRQFDEKFLVQSPKNEWFLTNNNDQLIFHYHGTNPYMFDDNLQKVRVIVETTFTSDYLATVIDSLDASETSQSFFVFQDSTVFSNHSINESLLSQITNDQLKGYSNPSILEIDDEKYSVQMSESPLINATLVSYIKLDDFLSPLTNINLLVYISLIFLFITGLVFAFLLYRNLHFNVKHLIEKIEQLGKGDYSSRVTIKRNNEFGLLFNHFNNMANKIQSLIENIYEKEIRTREAEYKHLQSQINPHFLYNCLFYIVSMANQSPKAVISMANNLAKYYRYITKKPGHETTLNEEMNFVKNYLEVQSLRNKRLHYTINISHTLENLTIPPLTIQPIVENAIIHGIDQRKEAGKITINGKQSPNGVEIIIEDDGVGMLEADIQKLTTGLAEKKDTDDMGHGLWNIHQRLIYQFGPHSGLNISSSPLGGLCVTVNIVTTNHHELYE